MSNDVVRGLAIALVVLWVVACVIDAAMAGGGKPRQVTEKPVEQKASESVSQAPPQEMTGDKVKRELETLRKTQTELAEALGVTRAYVSQVIRGKKPFTAELQGRCREILESWQK